MTALVLQLQADAQNRGVAISDLLRKAKVTATKLGMRDFLAWVEKEVSGYPDTDEIPSYRKVTGKLKFLNPHYGWRPIIFEDDDKHRFLCEKYLVQPAGTLEDVTLRCQGDSGAGFLSSPIPGNIQSLLCRELGFTAEIQLQYDVSVAVGVLDAIRNQVLDWALSLEGQGILGEGMTFNANERQAAEAMMTHTTIHIQNLGVLGDVKNSTITSTQTANYSSSQLTQLARAIDQIESHLAQMSEHLRGAVESDVEAIKAELCKSEPSTTTLRSALASLRTTCEGAAGNLIASGVLGLIQPFTV